MTAKAEQTRVLLADTALRLFREKGYAKTTMRAIAAEAGVSLGNAYYYFDGKDAFVQELYRRIQAEHRLAAEPLIREGDGVGENLARVLHAGLDVMAPYHGFGATMLSVALGPASAVSPFSADSTDARDAAVGLMRRVAEASKGAAPEAFGGRLPELLWLTYLGVTLSWVTDETPGQRRTRDLIDGIAPLIGKALLLTRLPGGRGLAADVAALIERLTKGN